MAISQNVPPKPSAKSSAITLTKCLDFRHRHLLAENLPALGQEEYSELVLNISSLKWINVFTISAILKLHDTLQKRGSTLRIRGCSEEVHQALLYLGLDKLIHIEK
jgi:anti-anti-sigma factor